MQSPLSLTGRDIVDRERALLVGVDEGLEAEPDPLGRGLFVRATAKRSNSRLTFGLGRIPALERFTLCHRYEPFWMKPKAGDDLGQVPAETQFLLARLAPAGWLLLVPLVGELFRFSLRGRSDGQLELLGETGDCHTPGLGGLSLFVAVGSDPFELLQQGARSVNQRLGTGRLRREKPLPAFTDTFGWCTWDAFYQEVSREKLREGLEQFRQAGVPPRFVILDDGWQSTRFMPTGERRLTSFAANEKFGGDLRGCVREAKQEFGVGTFLVWHAVVGYWGGVDPEAMPGYEVVDRVRRFGEGILAHEPSCNEQWWGGLVGLVPASSIERFFDDYHESLAAQGVDGVKVDNQAVLEGIAQDQGGRVALTKAYRRALEASVQRHFGGNLINCMANAQETYYGSADSTLTRSSIDFFPSRPETHTQHLYANAQVGLWFGEFMHPDWDMFQSGHEWGAYHAAARAVSGGPVYISDKPGQHNVALLKKLVCSDGSILRADAPALPTLDTLLVDPTREAHALKLWNKNGVRGVLAAFNARHTEAAQASVTCQFGAADIPGLAGERFACYAHGTGELTALTASTRKSLSLGARAFEVFTFAPIEQGFAAIGLADKFNSGASISHQAWHHRNQCELTLRDGGELVAYAERPPLRITGNAGPLDFRHDAATHKLSVTLPASGAQQLEIRW